jgi:hypothetical protein
LSDNRYEIKRRESREEFAKLIEFSKKLVIKDEEAAEASESLESSIKGYELIDAVLEMDNRSPAERESIIRNYQETNEYYRMLKEKHGVDYYEARMSKDFFVLSFPKDVLNQTEYTKFLEFYYSNLKYFMTVLYTDAFKDHDLYRNFIRLSIVFMTIERYISWRIEVPDNIDLYTPYEVKNMFISYGLDFFDDMPMKFQKNILKNLNSLLKYKGTDRVLVDILGLFGFKNVKLFKYYLSKSYRRNIDNNEIDYSNPRLDFIKVPGEERNVNKNINNYITVDYDSVVEADPFWQASKEEILRENFNYIATKYISLESMIELVKESMETSYLFNLLMSIRKSEGKDSLTYYDRTISPNPLSVLDMVVAMQILVVKRMGFKDNIVMAGRSVEKVYGFDFTDRSVEKKAIAMMDEFRYEAEERGVQRSSFKEFKLSNTVNSNMKGPDDYETISHDELVEMYVNNDKYRQKLEEYIIETKNYKLYRRLRELWQVKFTSRMQTEIFEGYRTYSDYLKDSDPELHRYIQLPEEIENDNDEIKDLFYREALYYIADSLDRYIDSSEMNMFINNNIITGEYIRSYIYKVINVFKAYTVDVREMIVTYRQDSKLFNTVKLFEEDVWRIEFERFDTLILEDPDRSWTIFKSSDDLQESMEDSIQNKVISHYMETMDFDDFLHRVQSVLGQADLLLLKNHYQRMNIQAEMSVLNLRSKDEVVANYVEFVHTLKDLINLKHYISVRDLHSDGYLRLEDLRHFGQVTIEKQFGKLGLRDTFKIKVID